MKRGAKATLTGRSSEYKTEILFH